MFGLATDAWPLFWTREQLTDPVEVATMNGQAITLGDVKNSINNIVRVGPISECIVSLTEY